VKGSLVTAPIIRAEIPDDAAGIEGVLRRAFADHPHSNQTEHAIVAHLRSAGELVLPHVAVIDGRIAGYATFSRVRLEPDNSGWYGLGPVAVEPHLQRNGIGTALIEAGLKILKQRGATGCVVLGEPAYYERFGFAQTPGFTFDGAPPEYFLVQPFIGTVPSAPVFYHPAFFDPQAPQDR
jgi:putative acetyltransferase